MGSHAEQYIVSAAPENHVLTSLTERESFTISSRWPALQKQSGPSSSVSFDASRVPIVVLLAFLGYAVWLMPAMRPWTEASHSNEAIEVTGEQFWWRIRYPATEGLPAFETANEIRLPVGQPATFWPQGEDRKAKPVLGPVAICS